MNYTEDLFLVQLEQIICYKNKFNLNQKKKIYT